MLWAPPAGRLEPVGANRVFPTDPGVHGYLLATVSAQLGNLVLLVWVAGAAVLSGRMAYLAGRTAWRVAATLTVSEVSSRLRAVLSPALLGPSQLLLFGPWLVHTTNRAEFLVPFLTLAPRWIWLLAPISGALAAFGFILPPRWFRGYVAALCAVGVLLWVQGNLLVAEYGLLGRRRPRPRVARMARPVRSLPVDRRGRPGDVLRERGEPGSTGGKRAVDVTAGGRPVGADARAARRVERRRGR